MSASAPTPSPLPAGSRSPSPGTARRRPTGPGRRPTRIALSTRTANLPSQTTLAGFLGTTTSGTDNVGLVKNALNHYLATSWFQVKSVSDPPSQAERDLLQRDVLLNLNNGYPLVANVVSGFRPPGYPPGPALIYTYVTVVGYDQGGARVLIADPGAEGAGGAAWQSVTRTYWISLTDLGTWIGGKGYSRRRAESVRTRLRMIVCAAATPTRRNCTRAPLARDVLSGPGMNTQLRISLVALALVAGGCVGNPRWRRRRENRGVHRAQGRRLLVRAPVTVGAQEPGLLVRGALLQLRQLEHARQDPLQGRSRRAHLRRPRHRVELGVRRRRRAQRLQRRRRRRQGRATRRRPPRARRPIGRSTSASTSTPRRRSRRRSTRTSTASPRSSAATRTGAYGGYYVIKRAFDAGKITWGWQTYAWSGGQWDARAQFRQTSNGITAAGDSRLLRSRQGGGRRLRPVGARAAVEGDVREPVVAVASAPAMTIKCGQAVRPTSSSSNDGTKRGTAQHELGTTQPRDRSSIFAGSDWLSPSRARTRSRGRSRRTATAPSRSRSTGRRAPTASRARTRSTSASCRRASPGSATTGRAGRPTIEIEALINLEAAPPPPPPGHMAHAPGDMAGQPGSDEDMAGADDDGGVVYGPDGGTDDMDPGTGGTARAAAVAAAAAVATASRRRRGCSYAGDARGGELPIGLAFVALALVARLARRQARALAQRAAGTQVIPAARSTDGRVGLRWRGSRRGRRAGSAYSIRR